MENEDRTTHKKATISETAKEDKKALENSEMKRSQK